MFASLTHIFERFGKTERCVESGAQLWLLPAPIQPPLPLPPPHILPTSPTSSSYFLILQLQFPLFCLCLLFLLLLHQASSGDVWSFPPPVAGSEGRKPLPFPSSLLHSYSCYTLEKPLKGSLRPGDAPTCSVCVVFVFSGGPDVAGDQILS